MKIKEFMQKLVPVRTTNEFLVSENSQKVVNLLVFPP